MLSLFHFLYIEHSSPKVVFFAYLVLLSHHPSLTFYDVPWSMLIVGQYVSSCTTSLKLDLHYSVLQSSPLIPCLSLCL